MTNAISMKRVGASCVYAAVLPMVVLFATATVMSIPPDTHGIDTVTGRDLFRAHCGSCHFAKEGFPAHHGPNLHDIGRTAQNRKPNQTSAEYILESILDPSAFISPSGRPGMPPNVASDLAPDEIRNIVGFLAGQGAVPDYTEINNLEIPDRRRTESEPRRVSLHEMELAERVIREKAACLECHSFYNAPDGHLHAPGIFGVGLVDRKAISKSLTEPHRDINPKYACVTIVLNSGQTILGQLMATTDEEITLCTRDEANRLVVRQIPIAEIEKDDGQLQIHQSKTSLMPAGFDKVLTSEEIEAVITLIRQLN